MGHGRMGRKLCPGEESREDRVTDCAGLVPEGPPFNTEVLEPLIRIVGIVMSVLDSKRV